LLYIPDNDPRHQELKQRALIEIKDALKNNPEKVMA
jgi:hypothetical protein